MGNVKVNVAAKVSLLDIKSGLKLFLDDVCFNLTKEQYNRIQASYNTKKFKYMSDDESLADFCTFLDDYYEYEELEINQRVVVSYPVEITGNLRFEDLHGIQDEETDNFEEPDYSVSDDNEDSASYEDCDYDEETDDEFELFDKWEAEEKAVEDMCRWMKSNGLDFGYLDYPLEDVGFYVVATVKAAWPFGVYGTKGGYSKPIALVKTEQVKLVEEFGYICFTSIDEFKAYIKKTYLDK